METNDRQDIIWKHWETKQTTFYILRPALDIHTSYSLLSLIIIKKDLVNRSIIWRRLNKILIL